MWICVFVVGGSLWFPRENKIKKPKGVPPKPPISYPPYRAEVGTPYPKLSWDPKWVCFFEGNVLGGCFKGSSKENQHVGMGSLEFERSRICFPLGDFIPPLSNV